MSEHFLVRVIESNNPLHYADLESDYTFIESKIPYELAEHGLCQKMQRCILRYNTSKKVFISREKLHSDISLKKPQTISVPFVDAYKVRRTWVFNRIEINEAEEILKRNYKKDEMAKRISIRIGAPRDAIQRLIYKLDSKKTIILSKKKKSSKLKKGEKIKHVKTKRTKTNKKR